MASTEPSTDSDITVLPHRWISSSRNNEEFYDKNALPIGAKVEEFKITEYIGRGGFGIVYLALDHNLHREVALKEYMPDEFAIRGSNSKVIIKSEQHKEAFQIGLRSFVNEAQLLARFNHPSFAKIHRFWEENDTAYIAMEYCQGKTFKEKLCELKKLKKLPDEVWLKKILSHLLDALDILHSENCLHRDISPDNILFRSNDQPVLIDFGAARYVKSSTQPLTVILKPDYAPPEQYGDKEQGPWTDIYALAAVIYFAIAGKIPRRKATDQLKPISESDNKNYYTRKFLSAIDQALSDKPENRPQSVEEFRTMLGLAENSISSKPRNSKKNRFGIILTTLALLIATAVFLFPANTPPESPNPLKVLDEIYQNRDPMHVVNVAIEKEVLRIGKDQLSLKISTTKPGYVYIFVIGSDRNSSFYRMFLSAEDKENYINTTSPLEVKYEMMGPPGKSHYIVIVSEYKRNLRNLSSSHVTIGNPECPTNTTTNCDDSYGATRFSINEVYQ